MGGGSVTLALEGRPTQAVTPTLTETPEPSHASRERWWTSDQRPRRHRDDRLPGVRHRLRTRRQATVLFDRMPQQAWRRRRSAPVEPVVARPDTVYLCPSCDAHYLGQQRCDECNTWSRRLGPGGLCPCSDEAIAITDLLTPDQFAQPATDNPARRR